MKLGEYAKQLRKVARSYGLLVRQPSHNLGDLISALKAAKAEHLIPPIYQMMRDNDRMTLSQWVEPFLDRLDERADLQAAEELMEA